MLCAFELLLREAGGVLSDVYGEPIDLLAEARSLVITPMHVHVHAYGELLSEVGTLVTDES